MARYVRISEEVFLRRKEINRETLFLYILIVFHTWGKSTCEKTLSEICDLYQLEPHNSHRRAKILRQKGWVEKVGKYYRPLVIFKNDGLKGVNSTPEANEKSVNSTPNISSKSVKTTLSECNNYTKNDEKSVVFTPAYNDLNTFLNTNELPTTTTSETSSHKSQFPIEEIMRYLDVRAQRGERIETPHKLARWMHQTGEFDVFINATLYPDPVETQTIDYDDGEAPDGDPQPLDEYDRFLAEDALKSAAENGENLDEYRQFYTLEDWQWLMQRLG